MSRFYFDGDSASISSVDDEDNLPYPEALPRNDFLVPHFDAPTYLSTLSNRHQTLEDLRSDLRERSQLLSRELLDLVNTNYEQFLGLGSDLKGGDERIEDVRVGLLGFKRNVEDVKLKVKERGQVVEGLLEEKVHVGKQISLGRNLLEMDARLEELEENLMVAPLGRSRDAGNDEAWSDSDEEEEVHEDGPGKGDATGAMSTQKLKQLVQEYCCIDHIAATVDSNRPFVVAQRARLTRVRNTLLLDLSTALKQAHPSGGLASSDRLLKLMSIYNEMGEAAEAVKALKGLGS